MQVIVIFVDISVTVGQTCIKEKKRPRLARIYTVIAHISTTPCDDKEKFPCRMRTASVFSAQLLSTGRRDPADDLQTPRREC